MLSASSVPATLWRAAASSLLIAGVIARFVFGAASFLGVPGALSGVALRKAADALGRGGAALWETAPDPRRGGTRRVAGGS